MKQRLLVVDDEQSIRQLLLAVFEEAGYEVSTACDGKAALREFFKVRPDLVFIDIKMPGMSGFELCARIRELSDCPIMFLTALGQESDVIMGFEMGGDDYVTKPVPMRELLARVEAVLRRGKATSVASDDIYADRVLHVDFATREVRVLGEKVSLTPTEFNLLRLLVINAPKVVELHQLDDLVSSPEAARFHVASLRRKLEKEGLRNRSIETVWGVGYRYVQSSVT